LPECGERVAPWSLGGLVRGEGPLC